MNSKTDEQLNVLALQAMGLMPSSWLSPATQVRDALELAKTAAKRHGATFQILFDGDMEYVVFDGYNTGAVSGQSAVYLSWDGVRNLQRAITIAILNMVADREGL